MLEKATTTEVRHPHYPKRWGSGWVRLDEHALAGWVAGNLAADIARSGGDASHVRALAPEADPTAGRRRGPGRQRDPRLLLLDLKANERP